MKEKFELSGNIHSKIGWYSSLFSRDYQINRSRYDASIRNWSIEFSNPVFGVNSCYICGAQSSKCYSNMLYILKGTSSESFVFKTLRRKHLLKVILK